MSTWSWTAPWYEWVLWNNIAVLVLAAIVWLLCGLSALRTRPALRHALWLLVMLKLLTPPLVPVPLLAARAPASDQQSPADTDAASSIAGVGGDLYSATASPLRRSTVWSVRPWPLAVLGVWILGTACVVAIPAWRLRQLARALRRSRSSDVRLNRLAADSARHFRLAMPPEVAVVSAWIPPLLWPFAKSPLIVLPRCLIEQLSENQIRSIVGHELAHLERRDHWVNVLTMLVVAAFWWNPLSWWLRRQVRWSQEDCCDAQVLGNGLVSRRAYANALYKTLEFLQTQRTWTPALVSGFDGMTLTQRRFEMIANTRCNHRLSWWSYGLLAAALMALPCLPARARAQQLELEDCPKAVQKQFRAEAAQGEIIEIERESDGDHTFYEAEIRIGKHIYDVAVDPQGLLLSKVLARPANNGHSNRRESDDEGDDDEGDDDEGDDDEGDDDEGDDDEGDDDEGDDDEGDDDERDDDERDEDEGDEDEGDEDEGDDDEGDDGTSRGRTSF